VSREICVARIATAKRVNNVYSCIRMDPEDKQRLQIDAVYTDQLSPHSEDQVIQLPDTHRMASLSFGPGRSSPFYLTYGLTGPDPYSAFVILQPNSDNVPLEVHRTRLISWSKAALQLEASRRAVVKIPGHYTIDVLLSWDKKVDQDILIADICIHRTWREVLAEQGLRKGLEPLFVRCTGIMIIFTNGLMITSFLRQLDFKYLLKLFTFDLLMIYSISQYYEDVLDQRILHFRRNSWLRLVMKAIVRGGFIFASFLFIALYIKTGWLFV